MFLACCAEPGSGILESAEAVGEAVVAKYKSTSALAFGHPGKPWV